MKATKEEHQLRGDWDSNYEEIGADSERFIQEIQAGKVQSLTDGMGLVTYGLDNGKIFIYDLYVLPEYRNTGVGGTLLDKVTEIAGGRPVALTVNPMNAPAIQLYRNHGFSEVGTVSDNGVELLRMERKTDEI
jgi:ribosomal protein S18 acetylase RimI-like enzyme